MHDVFYFTDIHGMYNLYKSIMDYCNEQDPEATIIFGGDAIDRGKDGYKIMKELLDNPKVIYLKGNHEDMFCKAAREIKDELEFTKPLVREEVKGEIYWCRGYDYRYSHIQDSLYNGGLETLTDWIMDGMPIGIVERIEHLPLTFTYNKVDFCHAGSIYKSFKEIADLEYEGKEIPAWDINPLIWSRTTIDVGWAPDRICVFGHTPTPYLGDYLDKFEWPKDCEITPVMYKRENEFMPNMTGWKLDMDTGAIFTGRAYVLNILTMQAQGFKLNENDNKIEKIDCIQF